MAATHCETFLPAEVTFGTQAGVGHFRKVPLFGILDLSSAHSVRRTNRELLLYPIPLENSGIFPEGVLRTIRHLLHLDFP